MDMKYEMIALDGMTEKWAEIVKVGLLYADRVEFNVLYSRPGQELTDFIRQYNGELINPDTDDRFYFDHKRRISLPITNELGHLLLEKPFEDWSGSMLEDPSFVQNGVELIGSITHEMICQIRVDILEEAGFDIPSNE